MSPSVTRKRGSSSGSTAVNGLVGALVAIVLSFIPFSTLLGGLLAGYLEGRDPSSGAIAGVVAGIVSGLAKFVLFLTFGGLLFGFVGAPMGAALGGFFLVAALFYVASTVVFASLGGAVGSILNREFGDDIGRV
ncbi:DUF5518 domain-containing protein [Halopiger djelfimassiliensis]|uniref:DUF5518 domain-containing protein n=1 Tax=Halopiger djelfimassiliensis TaxID=1293047 RepID=UPI000AD3D2DD|nr:DUF5518 domain-containing protein [Halopiger djelfimassiliensis]